MERLAAAERMIVEERIGTERLFIQHIVAGIGTLEVGVSSAKTALMTRFLCCFPLFEAFFKPVLGKLTLS